MSRPAAFASIEQAPEASKPLLKGVEKRLGAVPNLFLMISHSPAALAGYLGLSGALAKGALDVKTQERIALATAEINGCEYCLSAHTYIARTQAGLDDAEITANRSGASTDIRADAAVRFAVKVVRGRGKVSEAELATVRAAGFDDAEIIEIVAHAALNTLTNYVNETAKTPIDFPAIKLRTAA